MLRIIITSLLLVNAIFWGVYPPGDGSPHYLILNYFISEELTFWKKSYYQVD